jgi:hypothetical protein
MQRGVGWSHCVSREIPGGCFWHLVNDEKYSQMVQARFNVGFVRKIPD